MEARQCLRTLAQINGGGGGKRRWKQGGDEPRRRKRRMLVAPAVEVDHFDSLPDDIIVTVLSKLSSSANRPQDLFSAFLTCKRFHVLGNHSLVLSKANARCLAVRVKAWSEAAHGFLQRCVDCGNIEACFILGMIRFYALGNRGSGASLMAKAAIRSHPWSLYSLAIIQFNGSGGSKNAKDLRAGVALSARAAFFGHVDALRELGHCLQDGYGVRRNVNEGRRFLLQANTRELVSAIASLPAWKNGPHRRATTEGIAEAAAAAAAGGSPLLSDFGWNLPPPEPHPANRFLVDWFQSSPTRLPEDLRLCSQRNCGRPETRRHEFRRCSVCGVVSYCSRACQALDWRLSHKAECVPPAIFVADVAAGTD
ncbi:F-box protein At5g50450-like [Curcuma longa]|uniref:F-box protein At5g50450-like n=1 Tax=Curcuma longa TaxID=136217 RepID=UPI003D9E0B49